MFIYVDLIVFYLVFYCILVFIFIFLCTIAFSGNLVILLVTLLSFNLSLLAITIAVYKKSLNSSVGSYEKVWAIWAIQIWAIAVAKTRVNH